MRDIGGRPTTDGRRVKPGRIFRSGSLAELTASGRAVLERLDIRTVIDLRSEWECRRRPYEWPTARIVTAPLVDDDLVASITARFESGSISSEELIDWWQLTRVFQAPEEHPSSIRVILETLLAAPPDQAVLFHCRGGKDRTGMVAALVLDALGVDRSQIMDDFMLSNFQADRQRMTRQLRAIRKTAGQPAWSEDAMASLTEVKAEWMDELFRRIDERFGSAHRYLAHHVGVGDRGLVRLRDIYLEAAAD